MKKSKEWKKELTTSLTEVIHSHLAGINPVAAKASVKGIKAAVSMIVKKYVKKAKEAEKKRASARKPVAPKKAAPKRKAPLKKKRAK